MAEYIEREAFLADKKWLYCTDCDKRKGKKRGKTVTLYEIGEAPCKSCGIHDMIEEVEEYPAADVREVVRGKWISVYDNETTVPIKDGVPQGCCYCSVCGDWLAASDEYEVRGNFCPNCGADMKPPKEK